MQSEDTPGPPDDRDGPTPAAGRGRGRGRGGGGDHEHGPTDRADGQQFGTIGRGLDQRRFAAAVVDNVFVPFSAAGTVSLVRQDIYGALATVLLVIVLTVVAEGRTARTPGKALVGLRVTVRDRSPVDIRTAFARRPWPVLIGIGLVFPVVGILTTVLVVVVAVSIARAEDGRGLHDRLANTTVVHDDTPELTRRGWLLVLVVLFVGTLARLAFSDL